MGDPGAVPLLVVGSIGFASAALSFFRRRALWLRGVGLLGLTALGVILQANVRAPGKEGALVFAGVACILGSATLVTRGRIEDFFDDDSSPERVRQVRSNQWRSLALSALPIGVLFYLYRDLLQ